STERVATSSSPPTLGKISKIDLPGIFSANRAESAPDIQVDFGRDLSSRSVAANEVNDVGGVQTSKGAFAFVDVGARCGVRRQAGALVVIWNQGIRVWYRAGLVVG